MTDYELMVIIKPEVVDEEVPKVVEKVTQFISRKGGSITEINQWGRRKLAYPIGQYLEGNYVLTRLKIEPSRVKELEANLRLSEEVVRHLLVRAGGVKES